MESRRFSCSLYSGKYNAKYERLRVRAGWGHTRAVLNAWENAAPLTGHASPVVQAMRAHPSNSKEVKRKDHTYRSARIGNVDGFCTASLA